VAEVVGPQLQLEPVTRRAALLGCHHGRVVDQILDRDALVAKGLAQPCDGVERRQVELAQRHVCVRIPLVDALDGRQPLGAVAHRHDDLGAGAGQPSGQLEPDAVTGSSHHGTAPAQVGHGNVGSFAGHALLLGTSSSGGWWATPRLTSLPVSHHGLLIRGS